MDEPGLSRWLGRIARRVMPTMLRTPASGRMESAGVVNVNERPRRDTMPSAVEKSVRQRIGTLGLPSLIWVVLPGAEDTESVGFYDRDKADEYAALDPRRYVSRAPLHIKDASPHD